MIYAAGAIWRAEAFRHDAFTAERVGAPNQSENRTGAGAKED
jgi:hypothetical protein